MKKVLIVIGIIVALFVIYGFAAYNSIVTASIAADTQWKQVEADYQRRFDLIPNLVNATKAVLKQEQTVFTEIADARSRYSGATTPADKAAAANQVESALSRLLVIVENYPQLKSSETVQTFMAQNEGTENRINIERRRYNEAVQAYNLKVKRFPSSIIAAITGFHERQGFEAQAGAEVAPKANFE